MNANVPPPIKIINGSFAYGNYIVFNKLNIQFPINEITCIFGASGCGKTTILKILSRNLKLTNGIIENLPAEEKIATAYQNIRLIPHLTSIQNIEYVLPRKIPKKEQKEIAAYFLKEMGLSGFEHSLPKELSGGMQRRVGLARALAYPAKLILLDEAFDSLDEKNKNTVLDFFLKNIKSEKKTAICVTHDVKTADKLCANRIKIGL